MRPAAVNDQDLRKLWSDPAHWSLGIYFCKEDPRVMVPKRPTWMGWTVNVAHRTGAAILVGALLLPTLIMGATLVAIAVLH